MAQIHMRGVDLDGAFGANAAPLVALFERDDSIAVPLLSQMRMAGYDVRAARTPVELFDLLGKNFVSLVLVDLGNATAGRREFWVALDAQRRGRALQVMTFRSISPVSAYDLEFETSARAIADVEIHSPLEYGRVVDAVRQRIPLNGAYPGSGAGVAPGAPIPPLGSALGAPAPFSMPLSGPQFGRLPNGAPGANPFTYPLPPDPAAPWSVPLQQPMPQGGWGSGVGMQQPLDPSANVGAYNPYGLPPVYNSPLSPMPNPGSSVAQIPSPWSSSPFANPADANPFAAEVEQSPFEQPYAVNPFATEPARGSLAASPPVVGPSPFSAPTPFGAANPPASASPWGVRPDEPAFGSAGAPAFGASAAGYPASHGAGQGGAYGGGYAASYSSPSVAPEQDDIQDAWIPPDEELDGQTGFVPEVAYHTPAATARVQRPAAPQSFAAPASHEYPGQGYDDDEQAYQADEFYRARTSVASVSRQPTAAQVPAVRMPTNEAEEALGAVLVEGALLTANKLDALKGIQQMLAGVNVRVKLGELALRFKFLSPDQLLAALLVSRSLVSPQQIAALGRVKQELAASGMDHDLETLLIMFNVLPDEQLRQLRAELV